MGKSGESGKERVTRMATMEVVAETGGAEVGMALEDVQDGQARDHDQDQSATVRRVGYAPIVRVDAERREIELCATSEAVDAHGTIFDYAASRDAFTRWIGNVREMHDRKAVGSRVAVRCEDEARRVYVRVRISRGAQDTWEKVVDGTLRGASIGARDVVWQRQKRRVAGQDRLLDVAVRYELAELSLVDNPSNPDALGVMIVRGSEPDVALLDALDFTLDPAPARSGETEDEASYADGVVGDVGDGGPPPDAPTADAPRRVAPRGRRSHRAPVAPVTLPVMVSTESQGDTPAQDQPSLWSLVQTAQETGAVEEGIAQRALAQGWVAIAHDKDHALDGAVAGVDEAAETGDGADDGGAQVDAGSDVGAARSATDERGAVSRAQGPFSANMAGYPDMGTPQEAEARPTATLGMTSEGNARERLHSATKGLLIACRCPLCEAALAALDAEPDDEGAGDTDDMGDMGDRSDTGSEGAVGRAVTRRATARNAAVTRALAEGLHVSARRLELLDAAVSGVKAILQAGVNQMSLSLAELRLRVELLEAQPLPGGPAARAAGNPQQAIRNVGGQEQALQALQSLAGRLRDPQAQVAVAAELIRLQQEGVGGSHVAGSQSEGRAMW
ncbi:MAG: hypothetical protein ABI068_16555 [Ktedonobacterales bacterium]